MGNPNDRVPVHVDVPVSPGTFLARLGLFRMLVGGSILVSVLRSGPPAAMLSEAAWYVLQFGPIIVASTALLVTRYRRSRQSDHYVVLFLILFCATALITNVTTLAPEATLPQSLLLAGMTVFLTLAFLRRWDRPAVIRGDVVMVFVVIAGVQIVGVAGMLAGQKWAFDPDYGRFVGLFSNANYAGMMAAIGLAIGLYLLHTSRRRLFVLGCMAVMLVALLASGSRGSLLAIIVGTLVLVLSRAGRRVVIPMGLIAGAATVFTLLSNPAAFDALDKFFFRDSASKDVTSGRLTIYQDMLAMFSESPLIGTGYRSIESLNAESAGLAGHNIYLSILTETGLIGAAFFVGLIVAVMAASKRGREGRPLLVVVTTIATVELTESSIYGWGGPTALTAWLLILAFAASGRFRHEGVRRQRQQPDEAAPSPTPTFEQESSSLQERAYRAGRSAY